MIPKGSFKFAVAVGSKEDLRIRNQTKIQQKIETQIKNFKF